MTIVLYLNGGTPYEFDSHRHHLIVSLRDI
jgi:hypothetical protein